MPAPMSLDRRLRIVRTVERGSSIAAFRQALAAARASILYLPPYSPDLNPIEQLGRGL